MGVVRTARRAISVGGALLAGYRLVQRYRARRTADASGAAGMPERAAATRV
ncbi:MAG: hypothetical protein JWN46_1954 [Acidimicrobiales bacterium]|nr:hypothetical protein [Acidimicrobiales bacterium]